MQIGMKHSHWNLVCECKLLQLNISRILIFLLANRDQQTHQYRNFILRSQLYSNWKVGNGDQISFWNDNSVENRNLINILELNEESIPQLETKVSDFIINHHSTSHLVLSNHPIVLRIKGILIPLNALVDSLC